MIGQYLKQKNRGQDGFGLFDYEYKNMVHETQEHNILKWLKRYPSKNLLFHHRLPTSTANVKNACHPFSTKDYFKTNYILVHNGIITNDLELKADHETLGIKYQSVQPDGSFNDSEALLWDVALYLEGQQDGLKAEGMVAFICTAIGKGNKHDRLWFGRNSNPLNMLLDAEGLMLSSEGKGDPIDEHTLYSFDYKTRKLTTKPLDIDRWVSNHNNANPNFDWEKWWAEQDAKEAPQKAIDKKIKHFDYDHEASSKNGVNLIRWTKLTDYSKQLEERAVFNRLMDMCEYKAFDALMQLEYEYDCVALHYDDQKAAGKPLESIEYTLNMYVAVSYELEMLLANGSEEYEQQLIEGQVV